MLVNDNLYKGFIDMVPTCLDLAYLYNVVVADVAVVAAPMFDGCCFSQIFVCDHLVTGFIDMEPRC